MNDPALGVGSRNRVGGAGRWPSLIVDPLFGNQGSRPVGARPSLDRLSCQRKGVSVDHAYRAIVTVIVVPQKPSTESRAATSNWSIPVGICTPVKERVKGCSST